jgi:Flp pilus assembly pilin Flp
MWHKAKIGNEGQNLIEYAVIVAVVTSALVAMSTYVFRSIQATQQVISEGFRD